MDMIALAVKTTVDGIAAAYVRETHLERILPRCRWGTTPEIVETLERMLKGNEKRVATGHWTASANLTLAIRGALQAEKLKITLEAA